MAVTVSRPASVTRSSSAESASCPSNIEIHDLHVWSLDGNYNVMSVHVRLEQDYKLSDLSDLKEKIRSRLHEESIEHVTIEIEGKDEDCSYGKSKI